MELNQNEGPIFMVTCSFLSQ